MNVSGILDDRIGEFRVLSRIKAGSGNQGIVCKAVCESDSFPLCPRGTVVALKSMVVPEGSDRLFEKLKKNVDNLIGIHHANIVRYLGCFAVHDAFSEHHVVVQEFLEGETLASRLAASRSGLDADEAFRIVKGMIAGLAYAVGKGIIHRDVKPANVFLCSDGSVKIIDFEVSRRADGTESTSSGNMVGSFDYMAPEFADPSFAGDEKSDVFSAGVVMHEVFTGQLPYQRVAPRAGKPNMSFFERWSRGENGEFVNGGCRISYRVSRVLSHAQQVMSRSLAAVRDDRFSTFAEFGEALSKVRFRELKNGDARYLMLQFIGKGGFGEVFKARSRRTGQIVAIKHLLKSDYASRFYREARIMSELHDPCFVRFLDLVVVDRPGAREAFLVMDFLPGMPGNSLSDAIRRSAGNGLPFEDTMAAFARYAHGLAVMHARGIYHRDIKPANLYYPDGRPEEAVIMDFGIARDENGTKTNGQVPGTLDYMPPETALGDVRGDATMDIYALGLCLYEALTGKKGFPCLPSGNAAFAQFFKRALEKKPPTFDDERVVSKPKVLKLLVSMTEPDYTKRLSSAVELEKAIVELIKASEDRSAESSQSEAMETRAEASSTLATEATPKGGEQEEANTCETMVLTQSQAAALVKEASAAKAEPRKPEQKGQPVGKLAPKGKKPHSKQWEVRLPVVAAFAATVFVLSLCGFVAIPFVNRWLNIPWEPTDSSPGGMYVDSPGVELENIYGDDTMSLEQADLQRDRMLAARRPPALSREAYDRLAKRFEEMRNERLRRDRLEVIYIEARSVAQTYRDEGVDAGDRRRDEWTRIWKDAPSGMFERAKNIIASARDERIALDAAKALLPEAENEAAVITRNYAIDEIDVCDRNAEAWRAKWRERLELVHEDYLKLDQRLLDARDRRLGKNDGSGSIVDMFRAAIEKVDPVDDRMNRLAEVDTAIRCEVASGRLGAAVADELLSEIEKRREYTVFEVDNKSGLDLMMDGGTLPNGTSKIFVYTNAPPENLCAEHEGYEPFHFGTQMNGRKIILCPEHFNLLRVLVKMPPVDNGVTCRVDGVPVGGDGIALLPGSHECVYSRSDYKDQAMPFRVESGESSVLPAPFRWRETPALAALVDAELAVESGNWNKAEYHLKTADVKGEEALDRKRKLEERILLRKKFLRRVDAAARAYMDDNWLGTIETYSSLVKDGYVLTNEDYSRIEKSLDHCRGDLRVRRRLAEMRGSDAAVAKIDSERARLDAMESVLIPKKE